MARQIVVDIVGDASKLNQATSDAVKGAGSLTGRLQGVGKGMVIGAGIGAFNLLSGAMDMAIGKLGEAHEAFKADEASQALLTQALQNSIPGWDGNTAGVEAYAAAQGRLGFADDEVRASIGQLIGVTHDLSEAQDLNSLAQELARAKGIDLATATDIVTKAHAGNGKALKALGIDVEGVTDAAGLLKAVQDNVRGSAETWAATSDGKTAASQVRVGEAMEKIGGIINRVAEVIIPIAADAFVFLTDAISAVAPIFETIFGIIGSIVKGAVDIWTAQFNAVKAVIEGVVSAIRGAINVVIGAVNFVIEGINGFQIHVNLDTPVGPIKFDWDGLNLGKVAYLHAGGTVPGIPGSDVLSILQAGERVTPVGAAGAGTVVININGALDPSAILQEIKRELTRQGMSFA